MKSPIACLVSELLCFVNKQHTWEGFVKDKKVQHKDEKHHHASHLEKRLSNPGDRFSGSVDTYIFSPSPADITH